MTKIGIIGHGLEKFTDRTSFLARQCIRNIIQEAQKDGPVTVVSGHSPLAGVDLWAEEEGRSLGAELLIFPAEKPVWEPHEGIGFKARNIQIATNSDVVHIIVVQEYPPNFPSKLRYEKCYHCIKHKEANIPRHVKSGGCWTGWYAKTLGKPVFWHVV